MARRAGGRCKAVAVVAGLMLAILPSAALAGTLDQSYSGNGNLTGGPYGTSNWGFQVFTAGITGGLDQVSLNLQSNLQAHCSTAATVQIRDVSGSAPGTTVLASSSISGWGSSGYTLVSAFFPTEPHVVAGTQYAIVLSDSAANCVIWRGGAFTSSLYAGGNEGSSNDSGANLAHQHDDSR